MKRTAALSVLATLVPLAGCLGESIDTEAVTASPIIHGTPDGGDRAVVAVLAIDVAAPALRSSCTGSLIAPTIVLTAAHCVAPEVVGANLSYFVGNAADMTTIDLTAAGNTIAARRVVFDGAWNKDRVDGGNDIALIELVKPLAAAPLPIYIGPAEYLLGAPAREVGYGVDALDPATQQGSGSLVKRQAYTAIYDASPVQLMADNPAQPACFGDSGGPLLVRYGGQDIVVGIASWVEAPACSGKTWFTRLDAELDFLFGELGEHAADTQLCTGDDCEDITTGGGGSGGDATDTVGGCSAGGGLGGLGIALALVGVRRRRRA